MSDKYELKCQSTDDDHFDESENILLPEKKEIMKTETKYTFDDFSQSYIFQIIMVLIGAFIIYYGMKYVLSKLGTAPSSVMKGGRKKN